MVSCQYTACKNKVMLAKYLVTTIRDYPYYENLMNARLEKELIYLSNFYQSPTNCFTSIKFFELQHRKDSHAIEQFAKVTILLLQWYKVSVLVSCDRKSGNWLYKGWYREWLALYQIPAGNVTNDCLEPLLNCQYCFKYCTMLWLHVHLKEYSSQAQI